MPPLPGSRVAQRWPGGYWNERSLEQGETEAMREDPVYDGHRIFAVKNFFPLWCVYPLI